MNINDIPKIGLVYRLMIGEYHYTGSTSDTIHNRIRHHRIACKKGGDEQTRKLYKHIVSEGGWDKVKVLILESNIEEDKLSLREQSYINKDDTFCLNSYNVIAPLVRIREPVLRSDAKKEYDKEYYQNRKEELKRKRMERYEKDKLDPLKKARMLEVARNAQARYNHKKKSDSPS